MRQADRSARSSSEHGTTIVEALAAIAILGFALGAMLDNMSTMTNLNARAEIRSQATVAARAELERLRLIDPGALPDGGEEESAIRIDQRTFQVVTNYCTDADFSDGTTRQIRVDVFNDGVKVFDVETVFTRLR